MPKATVGAILTSASEDGIMILLTRRNIEPFKGYWCIPGGHIEQDEDAVSAVIREVKEETNLDFEPAFLTYLDEIFPERRTHNVVLLFHGPASGNAKADPGEVTDIRWFPVKEVLNMDLAFRHGEAVRIYTEMLV
jgi:8-oxo-dGTP diphosphatase